MAGLTLRQKEILGYVIESYITGKLPIGSRALTQAYRLELSPASVRHEMGILEEQGYLTHPHPSAGRVPTDKGYQLYVRHMVREEPVPNSLLEVISREMADKISNLETLMGRASHVLSVIAQEAVLILSPELEQLYFKELNLVPLEDGRLLAVWCTTSGLIQSCIVEMQEALSAEETEEIRNFINQELAGVALEQLEEVLTRGMEKERNSLRRLYEKTLAIVRKSYPLWRSRQMFVEGSRFVLNEPEFQKLEKLRPLIELLEAKSELADILTQQSLEGRGIQVAIGENDLPQEIWDCSLVSSPYVWRGKSVGVVGVLGPRRMPYGRIMGLVKQMAEEISLALSRWGVNWEKASYDGRS